MADRRSSIDLRDAVATIRDVAAAERLRRGRVAGTMSAVREWLSLGLALARVRLGGGARITGGATPPPEPGRPAMFRSDLHHAWRRATGRPGPALLAATMLGLGIALTTAMFTIADALILRPIPFKDPDRLGWIQTWTDRSARTVATLELYRAWRASGIFDGVEAASALGASSGTAVINAGGAELTRGGARVSSGLFALLGVSPIRGRVFLPDEGRAGTDDRVILSETIWRSTFGANPDLVGQFVQIDDRPHLVVGIMPADFRFPNWDTVVWRPIDYFAPAPRLATELPAVYVRWAESMPAADAEARATQVLHATDGSMARMRVQLNPVVWAGNQGEYHRSAVPMLAGGVALVFLVLCANVSGLLLAQFTTRRREYGVCAALGASRGRLIREAAAESALVGVAGVAIGLGLAWALVALARGYLPESFLLRSLNPLNLDARAVAAASTLGFVATLLSGVLPAWVGTATGGHGSLRILERGGTETRSARLASRTLLVVEIALACALLSGATILVRSFVNLSDADRGLRTEGMLTGWVEIPSTVFKTADDRRVVAVALQETLRAMPGIQGVAFSLGVPPGGGGIHFGKDWRSDVPDSPRLYLTLSSYNVGPDFFSLYGIPILRGRIHQPGDDEYSVVIGERLAGIFWPGEDPVGRWFGDERRKYHVIGLAREIHLPTLERPRDLPEMYFAFGSGGGHAMVSIGCAGPCPSLPSVRRRIEGVHAGLRVLRLGVLDDAYNEHLSRPRAAAALGGVFAVVALAAAAGGLLSVLTYAVNRRRREFGIRAAIGASAAQIRRLVLRDGLTVAGIGLALGAGAGWLLDRAMSALHYGVTPNDPVTWAVVVAVAAATTLAASWRPAVQAMRVDPAKLLRED
jgi:predicted permease